MTVSAILSQKGNNVITVSPNSTLQEAAELLSTNRIGAVIVMDDDGKVCGILSERDIVRSVSQAGARALESSVAGCMTSKVISATSEETVDSLMSKMTAGKFRHLPVIDAGRLSGIISIGDVVKRKIEQAERDAEEMKRYIAG